MTENQNETNTTGETKLEHELKDLLDYREFIQNSLRDLQASLANEVAESKYGNGSQSIKLDDWGRAEKAKQNNKILRRELNIGTKLLSEIQERLEEALDKCPTGNWLKDNRIQPSDVHRLPPP